MSTMMKNHRTTAWLALAAMVVFSTMVFAHHGLAEFDGTWGAARTRNHQYLSRLAPVVDALERGIAAAPRAARRVALDIGAGNGLHSRFLAPHFGTLASVDLSMEMLRRAPAGPAALVCGDASRLPVADGSIDALVLCNCFLFPAEVARVLSPSGVLAWINSRGTGTPIHLPADEVDAALPGAWEGVASTAGWGTWSVHWRQSPYS